MARIGDEGYSMAHGEAYAIVRGIDPTGRKLLVGLGGPRGPLVWISAADWREPSRKDYYEAHPEEGWVDLG